MPLAPSPKERIILAAEALFAAHGLDGVSLRQISAAAGSGNNTAVQYHFGTKEQLIREIFEFRLPYLHERRNLLAAQHRPNDLRGWVECYVLPVLEQGEQEGSNYLSFVANLHTHGSREVFDQFAPTYLAASNAFQDHFRSFLMDIPEPLRAHRISQAIAFAIHAAADRERAKARGQDVLSFAAHVADLLDGLVGYLTAPVSPAALAACDNAGRDATSWLLVP
ncbi:TetR/AcrR family transcriptional regulator [Pseudofrankia inefficax]|uniref:Regulatory protein TetR n=1 Tax=Pseudofrankia inefficax (strain DSM 45817 / CECT 9037 / DDB 130130 / EuI1c) TaxID=298654 RepID=E3JDA3_PSEI1|nr:TetR/AcrR family transcriptional regulator [Pseudofrankia inefficax]ADP82387.1 regulatory protein TetR [Pseudofrankia inefficax]